MFLFNSLHSGSNASKSPAFKSPTSSSLRRNLARSVFALTVMFCLSAALLFTGCSTEPESENTGFVPAGEWKDDFGGSYTITNTSVEFDSGYGETFNANIKEAVDFSKGVGVLLVQITTSATEGQTGKFTGVYYKDYTASHVLLANPMDESWNFIVKDTLAEAKTVFTVDNVDTHVTFWGTGYNK